MRINEHVKAVPDEAWNEATRHYDEPRLASLILAIASRNLRNRLNIVTKQVAGAWKP